MKSQLRIIFVLILLFFTAAALALAVYAPAGAPEPNEQLAKNNKDILEISVFVPAQNEVNEFNSEEGLARAVKILKPIGVTKIFLDVYRSGLIPDRELLVRARDYFRKNGFEVSGGITTTKGENFAVPSKSSRYWICYDNDVSRNDIKKISQYAASIFDEIIVDDFLATDCECEECAARKGDRDWGRYFRDVMVGISRDQIVGAAKAVNPKAKVIIKYPQWYERLHTFGYDVSRQPRIFDYVWSGTETRDPDVENVMQYQAFFNYSWHKSISGGKLRGAWFDQINTHPEVYMEQAFQSVLAGAPALVLFGYNSKEFESDNIKSFSKNLGYLFEMARAIKGIRAAGVYAYKPMNSDGGSENYIFDYLGLFGIPMVPVADYPDKAKSVILTQHAAADPDIAAKIKATVASGGTVLMTSGLLELLKNDESILELAGMTPPGAKKLKLKYADTFIVGGAEVPVAGHVEIGERLRTGTAKTLVGAVIDEKETLPVLTVNETGKGGRIVVFNGRTFSYMAGSRDMVVPLKVQFINTPGEAMSPLRALAAEPLGIDIETPPLVGVYIFDYKYIAFDNFNDRKVDVTVNFNSKKLGIKVKRLVGIQNAGGGMPDKSGMVTLSLPKRFACVFRIDYEGGSAPVNFDRLK
jgi:hypothetical protein